MEISVGTDPEFVLTDENGLVLSAIDRVGSKENPTQLFSGGTMFSDNVLLEINVPPVKSLTDFIVGLRQALLDATSYVAPNRLMVKSSLYFPPDECTDLRAGILGCDAEYCAWDIGEDGKAMMVDRPWVSPTNFFRSCGGHVHLGHKNCLENPIGVVRALDLFVGIPSLIIDHDLTSKNRRAIYGGAGYFRPTEYGLEYRTLSNFWLASPELAAVIYRLARLAVANSDLGVEDINIREIINRQSKHEALTVWEEIVRELLKHENSRLLIETIERLYNQSQTPDFYQTWNIDDYRVPAAAATGN